MVIEAGCHLSTNIKHECKPYQEPPLLQGDFIYYRLDPEAGFCTDDNGKRFVVNHGNVFTIQPAEETE